MKLRISAFSVISLLVLLCITTNACTIQKRVHRKGWYISWNKNYKSSNEKKTEEVALGDMDDKDASSSTREEAGTTQEVELEEFASETLESETSNESNERKTEALPLDEAPAESEYHDVDSDALTDELPPKNDEKTNNELGSIPLGGPYVFFGLFTMLTLLGLIVGSLQVSLVALAVMITALVTIIAVLRIIKGKNKKEGKIVRTRGYYTTLQFLALVVATAIMIVAVGGLAETFGLISFLFLLLVAGLLAYLLYSLKDKQHSDAVKEEKQEAVEEKKEEGKQHKTPEEKRKQRIAGLIVGGAVLALFLTIALLSN